MLNRQEVFNTVKTHLLTQGRKSLAANGVSCMYRGMDGAMCGIGPLIKDEFYNKGLEGYGIDTPCVMEALCRSLRDVLGSVDIQFLSSLQEVHDADEVEGWPTRLQWVANEYGLDYD